MVTTRAHARLLLREAEVVFAQEFRPALGKLGTQITSRVRSKMREDRGREKANVRQRVTGSSYRLKLVVYGDLPQTRVDEEGRKPGRPYSRLSGQRGRVSYTGMPPWRRGSELYAWVGRKGFVGATVLDTGRRTARFERRTFDRKEGQLRTRTQSAQKRQESIAYLIALKIARDGIPARKPFERTAEEARGFTRLTIEAAVRSSLRRLDA